MYDCTGTLLPVASNDRRRLSRWSPPETAGDRRRQQKTVVKYTNIAVRSLTCHTAMGTHMPYGITQYYLPPHRGGIPAFTPAEAGTRLSDPGGMQDWVDLVGLLILRWYTHPSTNRARLALTSFMRQTPLTTTPRHQPYRRPRVS